MLLPFGQRDGLLVSINDVESGLQENVVCPSCQVPLVARKGKKNIYHFAHHNGADCATGLQTALHMRAKEIIAEAKSIFIPGHSIKLPCRHRGLEFDIIAPQKVMLDEVLLEHRLDNIIPDVVAKALGRDLLIEIRVSHAVEESKIYLIKQMNLSAIEVDLSDLHAKEYDDEVLRERLIEQHVRKKWLHSPKIDGVREDVLMTTIYQTCSLKSFRDPWVSFVCPDKGGRIRLDFSPKGGTIISYHDCRWCEYCYDDNVAPTRNIWCGYKDKIKDYDSLLQSVKRKKLQQGAEK